jgi:hypothetical protein
MTSMRRLNRRLARWERYAARTYRNPRVSHPARRSQLVPASRGHCRALDARDIERERRQLSFFYGLGPPPGPCDCFDCRPDDDAGHGDSWHLTDEDDAYDDEGWPWPPGVVVVTEFSDRGLL